MVPAEAVLHDLNNAAYLFTADTIRNKAFKREVSLGRIIGNNIEITSGLNAGDRIVTGGQHHLSNGSVIILK